MIVAHGTLSLDWARMHNTPKNMVVNVDGHIIEY